VAIVHGLGAAKRVVPQRHDQLNLKKRQALYETAKLLKPIRSDTDTDI